MFYTLLYHNSPPNKRCSQKFHIEKRTESRNFLSFERLFYGADVGAVVDIGKADLFDSFIALFESFLAGCAQSGNAQNTTAGGDEFAVDQFGACMIDEDALSLI